MAYNVVVNGAPPRTQTKRALLIGASVFERAVNCQMVAKEMHGL